MIEVKIKDNLIELRLTSSVKRHEEFDERLRDFLALFTQEEFLEIFEEMKKFRDKIDPSDSLKHKALLRDLAKLREENSRLKEQEIKLLNKERGKRGGKK